MHPRIAQALDEFGQPEQSVADYQLAFTYMQHKMIERRLHLNEPHPACPNMTLTEGYTPPLPPSGKLYYMEFKYEELGIVFKPLRKWAFPLKNGVGKQLL